MKKAASWDDFEKWWKIREPLDHKTLPALYNDHPIFYQAMQNSNSFTSICDMHEMKYQYVSGNLQEFCSWNEKHFQEGGIQFALSLTHPQDLEGLVIFSEKMNSYFESLSEKDKANYRNYIDYRLRRQDGTYLRVLQQGSVIKQDKAGRIHFLLLLFSNITNFKKDRSMHMRQTTGREDRLYEFNPVSGDTRNLALLSQREIGVFRLISQGYSRNEVAAKLGISLATVKTHCQHVFEKLHVNDSIETINLLKVMGML